MIHSPVRATLLCLFLVSFACIGLAISKDPPKEDKIGPNPEIPQLNELKGYVGKYKIEVTEPFKFSGTAEGEWVQDGRFVKQSMRAENDQGNLALTGTHIFTYDQQKKAYRSWRFYSNGNVYEAQGLWDNETKTMTWTGPDADSPGTMRMIGTFDKEGNQTWKMIKEDPNGRVEGEIKGKHTLIK